MSVSFPSSRSLIEILGGVDARIDGRSDVSVRGMTQDSRSVKEGDLYCCVRGETFNGHDFLESAVEAGAVAVLADQPLENVPSTLTVITVPDVRAVLGVIAANGFGHPAEMLTIIGITGTNGKTSTAAIIASILEANGDKVRVLGTLTGERTTPEAIDLQSILHASVLAGITHVVMEVSSHALHQGRVNGITFAVGVFTNIARDHLDYHGTEENYFAAKALLFAPGRSRIGVVNIDDPRGQLLVDVGGIPMRGFCADDAANVETSVDQVSYSWRGSHVIVPMGGAFTLMNSLAAITTADVLGIDIENIVRGCAQLQQVPGRFESVPNNVGIGVVVDYAHTPDGLSQVLQSARALTKGRVIAVFGCGGNRDHGKRPMMGGIAASLSDVVFVTSDNPRTEDPRSIIEEILVGMSEEAQKSAHIEVEREKAIASAISEARRGDIVVIAGKGHEKTQEINGVFAPFNDVEVATLALQNRKGETS